MTLEAAVNAMVVAVRTLDGLKKMYDNPPESLSEFPCGIAYIDSGEYIAGPVSHGNHIITVDIYESRSILPQSVDRAKGWPDKMRTLLAANLTLTGAASHIGSANRFFSYRAMPMQYNDMLYYGVRFQIPVKVNYT